MSGLSGKEVYGRNLAEEVVRQKLEISALKEINSDLCDALKTATEYIETHCTDKPNSNCVLQALDYVSEKAGASQ